MELNEQHIKHVSGGIAAKNIVEALSIAIQVYENGSLVIDASQASIIDSTDVYVKLGHQIGEQMFNITHPNPLGKMIYTDSDFKNL